MVIATDFSMFNNEFTQKVPFIAIFAGAIRRG